VASETGRDGDCVCPGYEGRGRQELPTRDQVRRDCSRGNPGPASRSNATVRPHTANITATPEPWIVSPSPHVRPVSSSCSAMPCNRRPKRLCPGQKIPHQPHHFLSALRRDHQRDARQRRRPTHRSRKTASSSPQRRRTRQNHPAPQRRKHRPTTSPRNLRRTHPQAHH
jgi:hypothetical protein